MEKSCQTLKVLEADRRIVSQIAPEEEDAGLQALQILWQASPDEAEGDVAPSPRVRPQRRRISREVYGRPIPRPCKSCQPC